MDAAKSVMPDIFANVWVEISHHCIKKISNIVNAEVSLERMCKHTGTQMVKMFDRTTVHGRWCQILGLHRLLTKKQNSRTARKCALSKTSLQEYKCRKEKRNLSRSRDSNNTNDTTGALLTVPDSLSKTGVSCNSEIFFDTSSEKNDHFQGEPLKDQSSEDTIPVMISRGKAADTKIPSSKHETLSSALESLDNCVNDGVYMPRTAETKENGQFQPEKMLSYFRCSKCDFKSNHKNSVRDHESRVHFALPEKCRLCEKVFSSHQYLKRHLVSHKKSQCICDVCGKMYKSARTLEMHKKSHSNSFKIPDFECTHCKNSFSSKFGLETHIETQHAGKKGAFLCATCGKVFTRKYSLQQHQLVHTGSRLVCDVCQKSFSCESSLRDHRKIHTDLKSYKCPICSKTFKQRTTLQKHSKIHIGEKSFKCLECGRGFTQKQALQRHERSHKGLKPFTCRICHKSYGDTAIIRKHLILVHKIHKDPLKWKEDIIQNEYDSSFDGYIGCDSSQSDRNEKQTPAYSSYEGSAMMPTANINEMHISITTEHNAKPLSALPEDLSMSPQEVHQIQMHQLPLSMYQHSHTLYSEHVEPAGVDPSVYPPQHNLNSVSTYSYLSSSQTQSDQNLENNHTSSNHYLASSQPQSTENMEDNPASSHPYLSTQPPPHVEEDHTSSSHHYSDSMLDMASTQRPEGLTAKRLPDTDAAENLSLSTLYAYYSSLASQYLNISGYSGYNQPTDDQQQSQQNV